MRLMQLGAPGPMASSPLREARRDRPSPGPGQLLLEVTACAVCRTDLQLVEGDLPARRLPIVPGHQVVGRVAGIGEGVTDWRPGDRAGAIWLASACGACNYCRSARENLCRRAQFTGWDVDGGFATHLLVEAAFAVRLPPALGDVAATPLLCGGAIGYRALSLAGLAPGMELGLYGFGASASLAIQVAVHRGARVHVATRNPAERQRALALGADSVGEYAARPPRALDAAITFAPAGSVVIDALRAVGPGGTVIVNAIHLDGIPAFEYSLLWEERGIRSVANLTRQDAIDLLALAQEIPIVTEVSEYALADANQALADLRGGQLGAPAAVLVPR
jgi:propanol-preferring alcohol dehydrogenase